MWESGAASCPLAVADRVGPYAPGPVPPIPTATQRLQRRPVKQLTACGPPGRQGLLYARKHSRLACQGLCLRASCRYSDGPELWPKALGPLMGRLERCGGASAPDNRFPAAQGNGQQIAAVRRRAAAHSTATAGGRSHAAPEAHEPMISGPPHRKQQQAISNMPLHMKLQSPAERYRRRQPRLRCPRSRPAQVTKAEAARTPAAAPPSAQTREGAAQTPTTAPSGKADATAEGCARRNRRIRAINTPPTAPDQPKRRVGMLQPRTLAAGLIFKRRSAPDPSRIVAHTTGLGTNRSQSAGMSQENHPIGQWRRLRWGEQSHWLASRDQPFWPASSDVKQSGRS